MHGFDSRQKDASTAKGFEAQHGPDDALDESMILLVLSQSLVFGPKRKN